MNENESPNTFRPPRDRAKWRPGARWSGPRASCVPPKLCESRKPWPIRRAFAEHLYRAARWPQACPSWAAFALPVELVIGPPIGAGLRLRRPNLAVQKTRDRARAPTATLDLNR